MRGAFNRLCDVYYGPRSPFGPPNTLSQASVPCRLVPQLKIFQDQFPFSLSQFWLTHNAPAFNGPDTISPWAPAAFDDYGTADQVLISGVALPKMVVCRQEFINPVVRPSYWRCLLISSADLVTPPWLPPSPLPPPPPPVPVCTVPGASCALAPLQPPGLTCPYTASPPTVEWWRFGDGTGVPVSLDGAQIAGGHLQNVWQGPNCGALTNVFFGLPVLGLTFTPAPGEFLWLEAWPLTPFSSFQWEWN